MTLVNYMQQLSIIFFELIAFYLISCSVFEVKIKSNFKIFLRYLILLPFTTCIIFFNLDNVIAFLFISTFYFVCILVIFKEHFFNSFLVFVSEYVILTFIQLITIPFLNLFSLPLHSFSVQVLGSLITIIISCIIYKFLNLSFYIKFINQTSLLPKTIIANSFVLTFGFVYYSKISSDKFFHYFILVFIILLLILFVNGDLIITNNKMTKQKKQIEAYQEYLPIVEQLIDHVRQTQHAHNNNIQAIRMLPTAYSNYDELSTELMHYTNYLVVENEPVSLLKINLKLLSGFLYSKMLYAQSINKRLKIDILNFNFQQEVPEYDLITMVGILVDNAIEASKDNDTVYAELKSENKKLIFVIKNIGPTITPEFISSIFQKGFTTKLIDNKSHGIGLFHLKSMTEHYHGSITVFNESINNCNYLCEYYGVKVQPFRKNNAPLSA